MVSTVALSLETMGDFWVK